MNDMNSNLFLVVAALFIYSLTFYDFWVKLNQKRIFKIDKIEGKLIWSNRSFDVGTISEIHLIREPWYEEVANCALAIVVSQQRIVLISLRDINYGEIVTVANILSSELKLNVKEFTNYRMDQLGR